MRGVSAVVRGRGNELLQCIFRICAVAALVSVCGVCSDHVDKRIYGFGWELREFHVTTQLLSALDIIYLDNFKTDLYY